MTVIDQVSEVGGGLHDSQIFSSISASDRLLPVATGNSRQKTDIYPKRSPLAEDYRQSG